MKKVLAATLLALGLLVAGQQQAQAWHKFNFGVGLNISCEGGGNSAFWGLVKGAQKPNQFDNNFGVDGNMASPMESYPSDAPQPLHQGPEKIGSPTPVKPASYQYHTYQAPVQKQQQQEQPEENYYPSYWYSGR